MRIKCNLCSKPVSSEVPENTVMRAWVECPECGMRTGEEVYNDSDANTDQDSTTRTILMMKEAWKMMIREV